MYQFRRRSPGTEANDEIRISPKRFHGNDAVLLRFDDNPVLTSIHQFSVAGSGMLVYEFPKNGKGEDLFDMSERGICRTCAGQCTSWKSWAKQLEKQL